MPRRVLAGLAGRAGAGPACRGNPDNGRRPELVTSDTAGYSDMVFGLYRICGMQYAPRLADLSDSRF